MFGDFHHELVRQTNLRHEDVREIYPKFFIHFLDLVSTLEKDHFQIVPGHRVGLHGGTLFTGRRVDLHGSTLFNQQDIVG